MRSLQCAGVQTLQYARSAEWHMLNVIVCCTCAATGGAGLAVSSSTSGMAAGFLHTLCGPDHLAVRVLYMQTCLDVKQLCSQLLCLFVHGDVR